MACSDLQRLSASTCTVIGFNQLPMRKLHGSPVVHVRKCRYIYIGRRPLMAKWCLGCKPVDNTRVTVVHQWVSDQLRVSLWCTCVSDPLTRVIMLHLWASFNRNRINRLFFHLREKKLLLISDCACGKEWMSWKRIIQTDYFVLYIADSLWQILLRTFKTFEKTRNYQKFINN